MHAIIDILCLWIDIDCMCDNRGYGLTETAAATSITVGTDPNVGHTGPPLPCNEVKLVYVTFSLLFLLLFLIYIR
jgi:hypothetical protein